MRFPRATSDIASLRCWWATHLRRPGLGVVHPLVMAFNVGDGLVNRSCIAHHHVALVRCVQLIGNAPDGSRLGEQRKLPHRMRDVLEAAAAVGPPVQDPRAGLRLARGTPFEPRPLPWTPPM